MKRTGALQLLVVLVAVAVVLVPAAVRADEMPKNVVIIGWDGAQRDHLHEMIARNEVPNLMALAKQGALVAIDVVTGATDTKAGWAQIVSGYAPEKTGVYSNKNYQSIPVGYTIFERVEERFGPENIATIAVVGKSGNVGAAPPGRIPLEQFEKKMARQKKIDKKQPGKGGFQGLDVVEEDGKKFVETPAQPHYNASLAMDLFTNAVGENEKVAKLALENLEKCRDKPFVMFVHFWDPDHTGHAHGENSQQYTDAIKDDDMWTGKIVEKLKELGLYEKTLIYIAVDHGFNEGEQGHSYAPYVFLATNDPAVTRDGVREDIAPTILKHLGFELSKIEPPLDGIPLDEPAPERKAPAEKPGAVSAGKAPTEKASDTEAAPAKPKPRKKRSADAPAKARAGK